MATLVRHRRSTTAGSAPGTSDIQLGEIAVNTTDGSLFIKKSVGGSESIVTFSGAAASAGGSAISINTFTGNGSATAFTLSSAPANDHSLFVTINGIQQHVDAYSLSGNTLTFGTAPANADAIEARLISVESASFTLRDMKHYYYTISSTSSTVTGADSNSNTLAYDVGKIDVYQNGVKLVSGSDFTATNGTSVAFTTSLENGDVVEIVSYARAAIVDTDSVYPGSTSLSTTATNQTVDTFNKQTYRTAKYLLQATAGTSYHSSEVMIIHDGTTVYLTEYASMQTGNSLYTVNADISGSVVRLQASPANANTTLKFQRMTVGI